jgi:hypothetical protein
MTLNQSTFRYGVGPPLNDNGSDFKSFKHFCTADSAGIPERVSPLLADVISTETFEGIATSSKSSLVSLDSIRFAFLRDAAPLKIPAKTMSDLDCLVAESELS